MSQKIHQISRWRRSHKDNCHAGKSFLKNPNLTKNKTKTAEKNSLANQNSGNISAE